MTCDENVDIVDCNSSDQRVGGNDIKGREEDKVVSKDSSRNGVIGMSVYTLKQ